MLRSESQITTAPFLFLSFPVSPNPGGRYEKGKQFNNGITDKKGGKEPRGARCLHKSEVVEMAGFSAPNQGLTSIPALNGRLADTALLGMASALFTRLSRTSGPQPRFGARRDVVSGPPTTEKFSETNVEKFLESFRPPRRREEGPGFLMMSTGIDPSRWGQRFL